ncbi:uncharacterized protein EAE98_004471 [Botrytis deweyae]|uniref:Uncharacterized protein n=1 Tax=Botrytis deweyae TaxID=2478750 RepID=A0ABQ7IQZ3_9HELO|nr:uncharacterized protein EAE98_004471 [Botrytis deweyae]KAF7931735.1 hypothetical protein EAE98_004471 [Botrytis deweyae]
MPRRSSKRIPIHLPNPSTNTAKCVHPSSTSPAANSKPPIPKTTVQVLSNGSERTGGATPTRSEDPEGTVLPGRPVTADLKPRQGTPKGPIRRPHATPVEKSAEKFGEPPEGSSLNDSLDSQSVQQEEQSEIAKKLGESPEGDSMSNSGNQHELHLRNLSPSTEKISSRNPKEPVRDLYRPSRDLMRGSKLSRFGKRKPLELAEPLCESPEGDSANNSLSPQETSSELSTIRRPNNSDRTTDHRISSKPRTSVSFHPPTTSRGTYQSPPKESQQGPQTRSPTSKIRDQSSDMEVTRKNLPPNNTSPQAVPLPGHRCSSSAPKGRSERNKTKSRLLRRRLTLRNGVGIPEGVPSEFSSYRQYTLYPHHSVTPRTNDQSRKVVGYAVSSSLGKTLLFTINHRVLGSFPYCSAMPSTTLAGSFDELRVISCRGGKTHCQTPACTN